MHKLPKVVVCEVEVEPGQRIALPDEVVDQIGPGRWRIVVAPANASGGWARAHSAFLDSFAPEDEGLYRDLASSEEVLGEGNPLTGYEGFLRSYGPEDEGLYDDCVSR